MAATLPSLIALLLSCPLQPASIISFLEITQNLGQVASESLTEGGSVLPSCHQSDVALALLQKSKTTIKRWDTYPEPLAILLDYQWESQKTSPLQNALKAH
jgi:hypothetical protein